MLITNILNSVTPTWVTPITEQYNVNISPSENMKRGYYLFSTTPILQYKLEFHGLTDTIYKTFMQHWRDVSGIYGIFLWSTVPSYINNINPDNLYPMYGRWISQPEVTPNARSWDVKINFEKDFNYTYTTPGSVTQANMRLSTVNGTAFVDFSVAAVLTGNLGKYVEITDSAGVKIGGFIKAAGDSEDLGAALNVSNCENSAAPYDTFDGVSATGFHAITDGSAVARAATADEIAFVFGDLIKVTLDFTLTSGVAPLMALGRSAGTGLTPSVNAIQATDGVNTFYRTASETTTGVVRFVNAVSNAAEFTIANLAVKKVTGPSATGVTIVSTAGGSTYNWEVQETGFNYNDAAGYTYRIY